MRDIRARIAQRHGIELSNQQIQELAARRLESILDPRAIKPSLLDALRRTAGAQAQRAAEKVPNEPAFSFEDTTIYDSHRGLAAIHPAAAESAAEAVLQSESADPRAAHPGEAERGGGRARRRARPAPDRMERASLRNRAAARHRSLARQPRAAGAVAARRIARRQGGIQRAARPQHRRIACTGRGRRAARCRPAEPPPSPVACRRRSRRPAPRRRRRPPQLGQKDRRRPRARAGGVAAAAAGDPAMGPGDGQQMGGGQRPEPRRPRREAPAEAAAPIEQLPDTGVIEARPCRSSRRRVRADSSTRPTPIERRADSSAGAAPIEHAPMALRPYRSPRRPSRQRRMRTTAPGPPRPAPDPERHEY